MRELSSEKIKFTTDCNLVLKKALIDESCPGNILLDFNVLLNYIKERDCPLTGKCRLPIGVLPEINALLSHPIAHGLRRPQQKSYPHINGLFLLLLASEVTFVEETIKKQLWVVDNTAFQAWKALNHTEQYYTLLETWLLRGKPELIGEPGNMFFIPNNFRQCMYFLEQIPNSGLRIRGNSDAEFSLQHTPSWYNLALLELFGLISVRHGSHVGGKAWNIEHIHRTLFGDALFALLLTRFFGNLEQIDALEDQRKAPFGVLQPILQPYFTDWKNNLPAPERVSRTQSNRKMWF